MSDQDRSLTYALSLAVYLGLAVFPCHTITDAGTCSCGHIADGNGGCSCGLLAHKGTCESPGKHPATARGFKDASNEEPKIRILWEGAPVDSNIAVATGNGIFVVDCDIKPGIDGRAALAELESKNGVLPPTLTARTGSGGLHLYFRYAGGAINNSASKLGAGIDIRGDGGYVVCPNSKHKSGRRYEWIDELTPIADAPEWLTDAARRRPAPKVYESPVNLADVRARHHNSSNVVDRAANYIRKMDPAISGSNGHDACFDVALQLVGGFGLSNGVALGILQSEYNPRCVPPWSEAELRHKVESAQKSERAMQSPGWHLTSTRVANGGYESSAAAYAEAHAGGADDERAAIQGESPSNVVPIAGTKATRPAAPAEPPLPNDVQREDALIATLLFREGSFDECASIAKPEHFYRASNGAVYAAITKLSDQGSAYTPRDVANLWSSTGEGSRVSELERLSDDRLLIPMTSIRREAEVIRDLHRQREMIKACEDAARKGRARTPDIQGYLDDTLYSVDRAAEPPTMANVGTAAELAAGFIDRFEAALQRNGAMKGVPTQLRQFDRALGGLIKKSQIILAGRPSMGKTAAACQVGMNVGIQADADGVKRNGVLIFSLETTKEDLTDRMVFTIAGMCLNDLDTGRLVKVLSAEILRKCNAADREFYESNPEELRRAGEEEARRKRNEAAVVFAGLPLYIHHQEILTVAELKTTIRFQRAMWKRQGIRLALVIIDYLQLMDGRNLVARGASREQEVGAIAKTTRQLAQKEDFPLLALAQLNRAVEKQKDKRPTLADLRESGQIEMHADTVVFCHREEKYLGEECPEEWKGLAEFVIAKNKNGPTGTAWVGFHGPSMTFIDTPKSDSRTYND